jgi:hypothetical protein
MHRALIRTYCRAGRGRHPAGGWPRRVADCGSNCLHCLAMGAAAACWGQEFPTVVIEAGITVGAHAEAEQPGAPRDLPTVLAGALIFSRVHPVG